MCNGQGRVPFLLLMRKVYRLTFAKFVFSLCTTCSHRRRPMRRGGVQNTKPSATPPPPPTPMAPTPTCHSTIQTLQTPYYPTHNHPPQHAPVSKLHPLPFRDHVTHIQLYLRCRSNKDIPLPGRSMSTCRVPYARSTPILLFPVVGLRIDVMVM
jgi:hypothetical protein